MKLSDRITRFADRRHLPRRSIRLRLTAIYGGLFLVSGAALLVVTYVLVRNATGGGSCRTGTHGSIVCDITGSHGSISFGDFWIGPAATSKGITPRQVNTSIGQLGNLVRSENANDLHQLLFYSGLALVIMVALSVILGWLIAGRVLRPLRTITTTARTISATNLYQRIALDGPNDELKELGDTFDDLLTRLETFVQAQHQFVANASHELRSPLALQRTLIQVALSDPDADAESLRAAHERVLASGARQERLLEALLTLARGQTGFDRRAPFDLATVTEQVLLARRPEALLRGVEINCALAPAPMAGDPRLVERLVVNLVDNALRYNIDHGEVAVITDTHDGYTCLSVVNTGPIVPLEEVKRLVQPFQRSGSDRTGHGEGFGLGLSIVQAITEAHGASLAIDPQAAGGLAVAVTFLQTNDQASDGAAFYTPVIHQQRIPELAED
ncbi:MAG: HAMP domain-containing sensor histidine kinase [Acidimicrobiales bacterium]|jgi:signal transduction histidine kinase